MRAGGGIEQRNRGLVGRQIKCLGRNVEQRVAGKDLAMGQGKRQSKVMGEELKQSTVRGKNRKRMG